MKSAYVYIFSAFLCLGSVLAVSAEDAAADHAVQPKQADTITMTDPFVHMKNPDQYYITKGSTYTNVTELLASLPEEATGLNQDHVSFRIDKQLIGEYFYHVKAYDSESHVMKGNYFVAKDDSCVWRLQDNTAAVLIYGNAEKLIQKAEVVIYPERIPLGSYGIVRVHVPGMLPYDIKVSSLNSSVAKLSDKMNIIPIAAGKTDIVVDLKIGTAMRTFTTAVSIVDTADKPEKNRPSPQTTIGIGIGWGSGWYHHGGGIGIGWGGW